MEQQTPPQPTLFSVQPSELFIPESLIQNEVYWNHYQVIKLSNLAGRCPKQDPINNVDYFLGALGRF